MQYIEHTASLLSHHWAERVYCRFLAGGNKIPRKWPGTIDEAREVVAEFADAEEREDLASAVQNKANDVWPKVIERR
jgi:hypothetical protein